MAPQAGVFERRNGSRLAFSYSGEAGAQGGISFFLGFIERRFGGCEGVPHIRVLRINKLQQPRSISALLFDDHTKLHPRISVLRGFTWTKYNPSWFIFPVQSLAAALIVSAVSVCGTLLCTRVRVWVVSGHLLRNVSHEKTQFLTWSNT